MCHRDPVPYLLCSLYLWRKRSASVHKNKHRTRGSLKIEIYATHRLFRVKSWESTVTRPLSTKSVPHSFWTTFDSVLQTQLTLLQPGRGGGGGY